MKLVYSLLSFSAVAMPAIAQDTAPKNILFILVDDMQQNALRNLGERTQGSKIINGLIDQGTYFNRCYTMGSIGGALSMPSRAMLMTGRTLYQTTADGMRIKEVNKTLPETLRANGYRTFATGKWHSDFESFHRSFSEGENIYFGGMHPYEKGGHVTPILQHYSPTGEYRNAPKFTADKFSSEMYADAAVDFLTSTSNDKKPFFCYVAFTSPHDPHDKMPSYSAALDSTFMPLPANYAPQHAFDNGELKVRDETVIPAPRTSQTVIEQNGLYGGMINEVGIQIGRVLQALEKAGQLQNTIIVFASDNGLSMGQHGLMGKQSLYNHSVNVPLVIKDAGQSRGKVSNGLCYLSDVNPTLYDMVGIQKPESVTCHTLSKALKTGKTERQELLLVYSSIQRAVVSGSYKYIIYRVNGVITKQLFDLKKDPWEMNNLAENVKFAETMETMHQKLKTLMRQNHDFCNLDNPNWWSDGHKITWTEGIELVK